MKAIFIESDIKSFEEFHDKEWFENLFSLVEKTELEQIVENFAAHWWGSSRTFVLPWLLVNGVYDAIDSVVRIVDKTRQDYWDEYLKINAFKSSLWKLSESCFSTIYYAFENLIVELLKKFTNNDKLRITDRNFNKVLEFQFSKSVVSKVWGNNFISVSREVRNCIVHNGGKASRKLLRMQELPLIQNDEILISAKDVRTLYTGLKPRVNLLIEESMAKL